MNKKHVAWIVVLVASFIIALLYFFLYPGDRINPINHLRRGSMSDRTILAPFSFHIEKDPQQLKREQDKVKAEIEPHFHLVESSGFILANRLKKLFDQLALQIRENTPIFMFDQEAAAHDSLGQWDAPSSLDFSKIGQSMEDMGFGLELRTIHLMYDAENRNQIRTYLENILPRYLDYGILFTSDPDSVITLFKPDIGISIETYYNRIRPDTEQKFYTRASAIDEIASHFESPLNSAVRDIMDSVLDRGNIEIDLVDLETRRNEAQNSISPYLRTIEKGDVIVDKNQEITEDTYRVLQAMRKAEEVTQYSDHGLKIPSTFGILLFNLFTFGLLYHIIFFFYPDDLRNVRDVAIIGALSFFSAVSSLLLTHLSNLQNEYLPVAFAPLLIGSLFHPVFAVIFTFFNYFLTVQFTGWFGYYPMAVAFVIPLVMMISRKQKETRLNARILMMVVFFFLIINAINLVFQEPLNVSLFRNITGGLNLLFCYGFVILLVPLVEKTLKRPTRHILLELLDVKSPLLKQLSEVAPGTYSHSLVVGNLAEMAAGAVGAEALLARVGGYFHDIGKIDNPQIFTENNPDSASIHDEMDPHLSSLKIREHVSQGLSKAKRNHLPKAVIDIIKQHHGTSVVKFFFEKARKENETVDESKFRYFGPKPQTKEAAIVMIADIVESTVKSMKDHSEQDIRNVLYNTVNRLLREGQLDDAPLTMQELKKIKDVMLPILMGVHVKRIEYPKDPEDEEQTGATS